MKYYFFKFGKLFDKFFENKCLDELRLDSVYIFNSFIISKRLLSSYQKISFGCPFVSTGSFF